MKRPVSRLDCTCVVDRRVDDGAGAGRDEHAGDVHGPIDDGGVFEKDLRTGRRFDQAGVVRCIGCVDDRGVLDGQSTSARRFDRSSVDDGIAWLRAGAFGAVVINNESPLPAGVDRARSLVDQHEMLVPATDISGAADGAIIVQFDRPKRFARDLGMGALKLEGACAFERDRSIERGRSFEAQNRVGAGIYEASAGDGDIRKAACPREGLNDAAGIRLKCAAGNVRCFEVDDRVGSAGADRARVGDDIGKQDRAAYRSLDDTEVGDVVIDL